MNPETAHLGEDGERKVRRGRANAALLPDRAIVFLDDIHARMKRFGARTWVTVAQRKWIDGIDRDLDRAGAPAWDAMADEDQDELDGEDDPVARPVDEVLR